MVFHKHLILFAALLFSVKTTDAQGGVIAKLFMTCFKPAGSKLGSEAAVLASSRMITQATTRELMMTGSIYAGYQHLPPTAYKELYGTLESVNSAYPKAFDTYTSRMKNVVNTEDYIKYSQDPKNFILNTSPSNQYSENIRLFLPTSKTGKYDFDNTVLNMQKAIAEKYGYNIKENGVFTHETKEVIGKSLGINSDKLSDTEALLLARSELSPIGSKNIAANEVPAFKKIIKPKKEYVNSKSVYIVDNPLYSDFAEHNFMIIAEDVSIDNLAQSQYLEKFYSDFKSKIKFPASPTDNSNLDNVQFISFCKVEDNNYLAFINYFNGQLKGRLYSVTDATKDNLLVTISKNLAVPPEKKILFFYGDDMFGLDKQLYKLAADKNMMAISRSTTVSKSFNESVSALMNLNGKRIEKSRLSVVNGMPKNLDEAMKQSFDEAEFKIINTEFNDKIKSSLGNVHLIINKAQLIDEIQNGNNHFFVIIAHSDGKYIYFGSEKVSFAELNKLNSRVEKQDRVALILSCLTGKLFDTRKPFLPFLKHDVQSVAEILIKKNFFDFVIAPNSTITASETLKILEMIYLYDIPELKKALTGILSKGEMIGAAKK